MSTDVDYKLIGQAVNYQIRNLRRNGSEVNITLFGSPSLRISSHNEGFSIRLLGIDQLNIPDFPNWIEVRYEPSPLLEFPHGRVAELEFLLRKGYERFNANTSENSTNILVDVLREMVLIWTHSGELLELSEQKGLLGEINAILNLKSISSFTSLADGWDETSRERIDIIVDDNILIEAKTCGTNGSVVTASSLYQFKVESMPIILAVSEIEQCTDGSVLPILIESMLEELRNNGGNDAADLIWSKIVSRWSIFHMPEYFSTKWSIGKFDARIIDANSIPAQFADMVPDCIGVDRFTFEFTDLPEYKLTTV